MKKARPPPKKKKAQPPTEDAVLPRPKKEAQPVEEEEIEDADAYVLRDDQPGDALRERYADAEQLLRQEEQQLDSLLEEVKRKQRERRAKKAELDRLNDDILLFQNNQRMGLGYAERIRARRMSYLWATQLLITLVCLFGTYGTREWLFFGLNFFAFLCVWRGLYVDNNSSAQVVAAALCGATLYLK